MEAVTELLSLGSEPQRTVTAAMQSDDASQQESDDKPRECVGKHRHHSADKVPCSQGLGLPSGHVQLCELDSKEGRVPKN